MIKTRKKEKVLSEDSGVERKRKERRHRLEGKANPCWAREDRAWIDEACGNARRSARRKGPRGEEEWANKSLRDGFDKSSGPPRRATKYPC